MRDDDLRPDLEAKPFAFVGGGYWWDCSDKPGEASGFVGHIRLGVDFGVDFSLGELNSRKEGEDNDVE
jgi:hypothetical protein